MTRKHVKYYLNSDGQTNNNYTFYDKNPIRKNSQRKSIYNNLL